MGSALLHAQHHRELAASRWDRVHHQRSFVRRSRVGADERAQRGPAVTPTPDAGLCELCRPDGGARCDRAGRAVSHGSWPAPMGNGATGAITTRTPIRAAKLAKTSIRGRRDGRSSLRPLVSSHAAAPHKRALMMDTIPTRSSKLAMMLGMKQSATHPTLATSSGRCSLRAWDG